MDLIVPETDTPGAKAALVNRYMDLILRDGPAEERVRFLDGLASLDGRSLRRAGRPFTALDAAGQAAALRAMEEAGGGFFEMAKTLTSRIYYSTEAGFAELNKGGRVPETFACLHGGHE